MKGLKGKIRCRGDGRKHSFDVVLLKDGRVLPIDQRLVEMYEDVLIALEMGFSKQDLVRDNECMLRLANLQADPIQLICAPWVLPIDVLALIALSWIRAGSVIIHRSDCDIERLAEALLEPDHVPLSWLVREQEKFLQRPEEYKKGDKYALIYGCHKALDMIVAIRKGRVDRSTYHLAYPVAGSWVSYMLTQAHYRYAKRSHAWDLLRDMQVKIALEIVEETDSWTAQL